MNKITVNRLSKSFNGRPLFHNVSLIAKSGSVTVLLGQSGAGKSTFLRCLAQLETPDSGSITITGKIGFVFQQFNLWPHMTVLDNLILAPIYVLKMDKQEAIQKAKILQKQLSLQNKCHQYPDALSGGEQQRIAIIRALMMNPDILLFDEPTANLDHKNTQNIADTIKSLASQGITAFIATHDTSFANEIATETLFLGETS